MKKTKKVLIFLGLMFIVFLFSFYVYLGFFIPRGANNKIPNQKFIVEKGSPLSKIVSSLQGQGLIRHRVFLIAYLNFKKEQKNIKAGGYFLSPSMTIQEISTILLEGKTSSVNMTIPEGWNVKNIAEYLEKLDIIEKEEFYYALENYSKNKKIEPLTFISEISKNASPEGFLFPDSYLVRIDATANEIIEMMLENFEIKVAEKLKENLELEKEYSLFEIITIASLLEKEVKSKEDKELVSGIIRKRFEQEIPLELCSTIVYLTGKKDTKISSEEINIDSPYNTYLYPGLPPGPIANPGLESILAALKPKQSPYWYYLSTPEGETLFSLTIEEHNIKKAKYLK